MQDILASNTDPKANPFWSIRAIYSGKIRRPAALKTGTSTDEIDLAAMGFLAPPKDPKAEALVVGAWMGNSDNSAPPNGTVALETAASLWQSFLEDASKGTPIAQFAPHPPGVVQATVDANSGMLPGPYTAQDGQGVVHRRHGPDPGRRHQGRRPDRRGDRPPVAGRLPRPGGDQGLPRLLERRARPPDLGQVHPGLGRPRPARRRACGAGPRTRRRPTSTSAMSIPSAPPGARRSRRPRPARSADRRPVRRPVARRPR